MELTLIAATLMLSIGLGLAGAHAMLSIVFFFKTRSIVQREVQPAMSSERASSSQIAGDPREALALSGRAA
jgi:hypothetical protein